MGRARGDREMQRPPLSAGAKPSVLRLRPHRAQEIGAEASIAKLRQAIKTTPMP